jgi:hypothetical protein
LVYTSVRLQRLRGARPGYGWFSAGAFLVLFLAGFAVAPVAALALFLLLGAAAVQTAKELRFRNHTVQYNRGNRPGPPRPLRRWKSVPPPPAEVP